MKLRSLVWLPAAALALAGCDLATGSGNDRADAQGRPRQEAGPAADLVGRMTERGRLPQLEYVCFLIGPDEGSDKPYGRLGVVNTRYTLIAKGGGRLEGDMTLNADHTVAWEGDLGMIDDAPRRVTGARVNAEGQTVEIAFDFSPATEDEAAHNQVVCRAEAP